MPNMNDTRLTPYINFPSTTTEAMNFYKEIFGGKLEIMTFGDTPMNAPEEKKNLAMHAQLDSEAIVIMASDGMKDDDIVAGNNVNLSLSGTNDEVLTGYFEKLSEGGSVKNNLEKQFWGDKFGTLTDKFGIHWMINITSPDAK
jgi:PhnB protein